MIRVGIGGWTFEPWRGTFFPKGLPAARELEYASERLTAIEINGTYYRTQTPDTFKKWAKATPENFMFSVKASRFSTNRKDLATAGESIAFFLNSGVLELGDKLGPILWQFAPTKKFTETEIGGFLDLLPEKHKGHALRHVIEAKHPSFESADFIALARKHKVGIVQVEDEDHMPVADLTAGFVYARLQNTQEEIETGYPLPALKQWAKRAQAWEKGEAPKDLKLIAPAEKTKSTRDVFLYFISGAKVRAPAAAMAMIEQLKK
ncbi:MAG: DUF72 domain-containing protein [Terricaulis sp.]